MKLTKEPLGDWARRGPGTAVDVMYGFGVMTVGLMKWLAVCVLIMVGFVVMFAAFGAVGALLFGW